MPADIPRLYRLPMAASAAVGGALLPMPYWYYVLLGLFLCGACVYYLSTAARIRDWQKWILVGLVIFYNPIFPVNLGDKMVWTAISVATVIFFWVLARGLRFGR